MAFAAGFVSGGNAMAKLYFKYGAMGSSKTATALITKYNYEERGMITADHGCDPGYLKHTDHTREYIPLVMLGKGIRPVNLGTRPGFCDIAATVTELLGVPYETPGRSFAKELL